MVRGQQQAYCGLRTFTLEDWLQKHTAVSSEDFVKDPGTYYFRMTPIFETAARQYDWIHRIVAVGAGHRLPEGPLYSLFEVL